MTHGKHRSQQRFGSAWRAAEWGGDARAARGKDGGARATSVRGGPPTSGVRVSASESDRAVGAGGSGPRVRACADSRRGRGKAVSLFIALVNGENSQCAMLRSVRYTQW